MSARDRALNNQDRETIQMWIQEGSNWVTPEMIAREQRLVRLEALDSEELASEVFRAIRFICLGPKATDPEVFQILQSLNAAGLLRIRVFEDPRGPLEGGVDEILISVKKEFEKGLNQLADLELWTRS
jgi:hypothetical protein